MTATSTPLTDPTVGAHVGAPVVMCFDDTVTTAEVVASSIARSGDTAWADRVVDSLEPGQVAIVALGFESDAPAVAHLLGDLTLRTPREFAPATRDDEQPRRHTTRLVPQEQGYARAVETALGRIRDGAVEKVVLGRWAEVLSEPPVAPMDVVGRLLATRPGRYVFSLPVPDADGAATLFGASPELLVSRRDGRVSAMPLAGSVPRHPDPVEDERRRTALLSSEKDLREHAYVVRDLVERLRQAGVDVDDPGDPEVLGTDTMWHLGTRVSGDCASAPRSLNAVALAQAVHPTPAVGGVPTAAAVDLVADLEAGPRGWLAGTVGWVDAHGDGEFALTLRAGVHRGGQTRLFAGAGIVAGSEPASEVAETAAKLGTMIAAVTA